MASARDPGEVMERVLPDIRERKEVLRVLLDSCRYADSLAPNAWSLSLRENGFRLNVGRVEALACFGNGLRVLVAAPSKSSRLKGLAARPTAYASGPDPQCAVVVSPADAASKVRDLHFDFIKSAATTKSGKPRKGTSLARHHSPALLSYAEAFLKNPVRSPNALHPSGQKHLPGELKPEEAGTVVEGAMLTVVANRYERDLSARSLCIAHWGCRCVVCNLDFASVYGEIGSGYIHVHHLVPLSKIGEAYEVDPVNDLRPVCPNCHAMLHRREPPYTPEELRKEIGTGPRLEPALR